jgi:hypothetical protein
MATLLEGCGRIVVDSSGAESLSEAFRVRFTPIYFLTAEDGTVVATPMSLADLLAGLA